MHCCIYMIGDIPQDRLTREIRTPNGTSDWAGIGGRYTGKLIPMLGATTGVVYGDTLPSSDAWLAKMTGESGLAMIRPGDRGPGVDQLKIRDLDLDATSSPVFLVDAADNLHTPDLTEEEEAMVSALALADRYGLTLGEEPDDAEMNAIMAKMAAWQQRYREVITAADPDALITVVDVHA